MKKFLVVLLMLLPMVAFADNTANSNSVAASVSGSNASQGNAQNIHFNNSGQDSYSLKTVPTVYAPPIGVSAPCALAISGGVSVMGFGGSLGSSVKDSECNLRETARILYEMGAKDASLRVMCGNPAAAKALGDTVCGSPPPVAEATPQ